MKFIFHLDYTTKEFGFDIDDNVKFSKSNNDDNTGKYCN